MPRDLRYVEKLATPDVTIADISRCGPDSSGSRRPRSSDELTIHYGFCRARIAASSPSTNCRPRGKNSGWPLQHHARGDVQIKGYPLRLPLDVLLVFSANPKTIRRRKNYYALKDRIARKFARTPTTSRRNWPSRSRSVTRRIRRFAWMSRLSAATVENCVHARTTSAWTSAPGVQPALAHFRSVVSQRRAARRGTRREICVARVRDLYAALPPSPENLNSNTKAS